jgi:hypothetical protein
MGLRENVTHLVNFPANTLNLYSRAQMRHNSRHIQASNYLLISGGFLEFPEDCYETASSYAKAPLLIYWIEETLRTKKTASSIIRQNSFTTKFFDFN